MSIALAANLPAKTSPFPRRFAQARSISPAPAAPSGAEEIRVRERRDRTARRAAPLPPSAAAGPPTSGASQRRSPRTFFAVVFALSVPFWLAGVVTDRELLEDLPVSTLTAVCPLIAAAILVHRESGIAGLTVLLKRSVDATRSGPKVWYAPALLLMPGATVLTYAAMRLLGRPLPSPDLPLLAAPAMFLAFLLPALCEEVGWSGYALDPLQARRSALRAALLLGLVGVAWHLVPLLQGGRSPTWIAWWSLSTVALRVLTVWLYNNTGRSVFVATLFHAATNVGSITFATYYDPRITGPIVALAAAAVVVGWGPRTLARDRFA
jgi:membrane protease YdiL (CAAX protease family)